MTSGGSGSCAAAQGVKCFKVLMSSLEGVAPVSNPRRLHHTWCTQLLSVVKVSYLFGRRSSTFTPVGRAASCWSILFSSPLIAHFFGGDRHGGDRASLPALGWFTSWCGGSLRHLESEVTVIVPRDDDLSYFLWVRLKKRL